MKKERNTAHGGIAGLALRAGKGFGVGFTVLLYLVAGPLYALPRCAEIAFSLIANRFFGNLDARIAMMIFSFGFFLTVLLLSVKQRKKTLGRDILSTALLLCSLAVLPMGDAAGNCFLNSPYKALPYVGILLFLAMAVGLTVSGSEAFMQAFPKQANYVSGVVTFVVVAYGVVNFGLPTLVKYAAFLPAFLLPVILTLLFLGMTEGLFERSRTVYLCTLAFAALAAALDGLKALLAILVSEGIALPWAEKILAFAEKYLPFCKEGFGWVCPAMIGFVFGTCFHQCLKRTKKEA